MKQIKVLVAKTLAVNTALLCLTSSGTYAQVGSKKRSAKVPTRAASKKVVSQAKKVTLPKAGKPVTAPVKNAVPDTIDNLLERINPQAAKRLAAVGFVGALGYYAYKFETEEKNLENFHKANGDTVVNKPEYIDAINNFLIPFNQNRKNYNAAFYNPGEDRSITPVKIYITESRGQLTANILCDRVYEYIGFQKNFTNVFLPASVGIPVGQVPNPDYQKFIEAQNREAEAARRAAAAGDPVPNTLRIGPNGLEFDAPKKAPPKTLQTVRADKDKGLMIMFFEEPSLKNIKFLRLLHITEYFDDYGKSHSYLSHSDIVSRDKISQIVRLDKANLLAFIYHELDSSYNVFEKIF